MIYMMEEAQKNNADIKVFGIGGGGCNAVNRMVEMNLAGIDFVASNTDLQSLSKYNAPTLVQLGANLTRGLGAGGNPKVGREAALEDEDKIRSFLEGSDMVFITAGMGGGTGTGGAPVVAQIARELGALTIAVVTKPFRFEGKRRWEIADAGIRDLEEFVDTLIVIPNQKLLSTVEHTTTLQDSFKVADDVLSNAVQGISDLITVPGLINLDFADVKTIMSGMGKALMGTGYGSGETKAVDAVQRSISSSLLDEMSVKGARGILINITGGKDLTLVETDAALAAIFETADSSANIIFGAVISDEYENRVKATVIATGFEGATIRKDRNPLSLQTFKNTTRQEIEAPETPTPTTEIEQRPEPERSTDTDPAFLEESDTDEIVIPVDFQNDIATENHSEPAPEVDMSQDIEPEPVPEPEIDQLQSTTPNPSQSQTDLPFDHRAQKELTLPKQTRKMQSNPNPELELQNPSSNTIRYPAKLPDYQRIDLSTISNKTEKEGDSSTLTVDTSNYMIPAFLRRKAD